MGGNIFPDNQRIPNKDSYYKTVDNNKTLFNNKVEFYLPSVLKDKTTFGDIDIIYDNLNTEYVLSILKESGLPFIKNGSVISYQTKDKYQIDLIGIQTNSLAYAVNYFSYSDHGNILGRLSKLFNLKHGFNGLQYLYKKDDGNYQRSIDLSFSYEDILTFLCLDINSFKEGFENEEHLFNWIYSSPFINTEIFKFENLNNKNRVRDFKRKCYNNWLSYLKDKPVKNFKPTSSERLDLYFPFLQEEILKLDYSYNEMKLGKQLFNGQVVSTLTGLTGPALGKFMGKVKLHFTKPLSQYTQEEIKQIVLQVHNRE